MRNTDAGVRAGWAVIPARAACIACIALLWLFSRENAANLLEA
jgi:hypothetical protein